MSISVDCGFDYTGFKAVVTALSASTVVLYNKAYPVNNSGQQQWFGNIAAYDPTTDNLVLWTGFSNVSSADVFPSSFNTDFPSAVGVAAGPQWYANHS